MNMTCTNGSTADTNAELHKAERIVNTAFIFGLGECGQLPRHLCSNVDYIQEEPAAIDILPNNVDEVVCGSMHTIVKTKDDKLFSFGCNDMGVLGRVTKDSSNPKEAEDFPNIINFDFPDKIKKITCGDNHTAVLLQNGKVYITGGFRDNGGVLGIPSFKKDNEVISNTFHFLEVKFSFSVAPTSASSDTTISPMNKDVSVLQNGDIAAGNSASSELKNEYVIITDIASGEDHLICVDASREYIYTIGNSDSCQVLNKFYDSEESETYRYKYLFPKCYHYNKDLSFETKIEKIFCGGNNTFVQVHSKEVYAIGRNAYGSCGVSSNENVIKQFQKIPILSNKEIKQLCGGQTFTVCLLANNDLYIWGNREMLMGQLEEDAYEPIQLNFFKDKNIQIKHVSCGTDHCLVLAEDGKLYAWGYGGNCFNLQKAVGALESKIPMEIKYLNYFKEIVENPKVDAQHFLNSIKIESLSGGSAHCTFILSHLDERQHLLKRSREAAELEKEAARVESTQKRNENENENEEADTDADADADAALGKRAKFETDDSCGQVNHDFEIEDRTKEEEFSEVLSVHKKITTPHELMAQSAEDKEREIKEEEEEKEKEKEIFSEKEKNMLNGVGVVKGIAEEGASRGSETEDHMRGESVGSIPVVQDFKSEALKIEELQGGGGEEEGSAVEEAYLKSEEELGTDVDAGTEEKGELFHSAYSEVEQRSPATSKENSLSAEKEKQKEEEGLISDFSKREEEQEGKEEGEGEGEGAEREREREIENKGVSVKRTKSARSKPAVNVESPVRKQPRRSCKENIVTLNENEIAKQYQHVEQMISKKSSNYKYRKTKSAAINKKENSKSKRKSAGRATVSAGAGRSKKKAAAPPVNEKKKVKEETTQKKGKTTKGKEVAEMEEREEEGEKETENVEEKEEDEEGGGEEEKRVLAKGKKRESKSKAKKENAETQEKGSEQKKAKKNEKEKEKVKEHGTEKEKDKDKKKEKEKEKEKDKDKDKDKDKEKEKEKDKERAKKTERKSKISKEEVSNENEEKKAEEEQANEPEKDKDKKRKRESKKKDSFSRENLKRESFSAAEEKITKSKSSKFKH